MEQISDNTERNFRLHKRNFGFWTHLRTHQIRMYRNKVFHYGSLITVANALNEPTRIHNMIYKLIRDMNANAVLKQIKRIDDFDEKYAKGKSLGYFR